MDTTKHAILICGLPGSGKSTYALNRASHVNGAIIIDDPRTWDEIAVHIEQNETCIILTDPHLCIEEHRKEATRRFRNYGYVIEWVFFENDPKQCRINALKRNDKAVMCDIVWFSEQYHIPQSIQTVPVFTNTEGVIQSQLLSQ